MHATELKEQELAKIDIPSFDGNISTKSETTIVSQATPSLEDLNFQGVELDPVLPVLTLGL